MVLIYLSKLIYKTLLSSSAFSFAIFAIFIYRHNIILISLIHQSIMMSSYKHHPSSGFFSAFLFAILDLKHHVIWSFTNTLQNLSSQIFGLQIRYSEHYALICKNDTFLFFFYKKYFKIKNGHFNFVHFGDSQKSFEKNMQLAYCDYNLLYHFIGSS